MVKDYVYDARGRLLTQTEGTASEVTLSATLSNFLSVTFKYDPATNDIVEKQFNGPNDTRRVVFRYREDNGLLYRTEIYPSATATTPIWWRDLTFDPKTWRPIAAACPNGVENVEYDANGRVTQISAQGGEYGVAYSYTEIGALKSVKSKQLSSSGAEEKTVTYEYDSLGRRTKISRPNGTSTEYTYSPLGEYATITHKRGSTPILNLAYTRDKTGIITQTVETREGEATVTWNYTYDQQKRLTAGTRAESGGATSNYTYTYDNAGNRLTESFNGTPKSFAYNTLGQLYQSIDGEVTTTYAYDAYGNLAEEKETISGNTTDKSRYTWDSENHLIQARKYNSGSLYWTIAYTYDENGTRISQKVNSQPGVRFFTSDNTPTGYSQTLSELDESATNPQQSYVWGDDLLAQSAPAAPTQLAFAHGDNLGSIRKLTASDGASISNSSFNYEPYGSLKSGSDASLTPYRFTGQYYDQYSALQYHRARWLDCMTANWLSQDSFFDYPGNFGNHYSYVGGRTVSNNDPLGKFTLCEIILVSLLVAMLATVAGSIITDIRTSYQIGRDYPASTDIYLWEIGIFAAKQIRAGDNWDIQMLAALKQLPQRAQPVALKRYEILRDNELLYMAVITDNTVAGETVACKQNSKGDARIFIDTTRKGIDIPSLGNNDANFDAITLVHEMIHFGQFHMHGKGNKISKESEAYTISGQLLMDENDSQAQPYMEMGGNLYGYNWKDQYNALYGSRGVGDSIMNMYLTTQLTNIRDIPSGQSARSYP